MSTRQRERGPRWRVVVRDLASITLPWVVIFKQAGIGFAPPAEVNVWLLALMGAALGIPGAAQVLPKLLSVLAGHGGTDGPPSAEVPPQSRPGQSSSIGPSAGDP